MKTLNKRNKYHIDRNIIKEIVMAKRQKRGADLRGADLWGADLRGADLWGADLREADLREADLRGADLRGADLWGANLCGSSLCGANLWGAKNIYVFIAYDTSKRMVYCVKHKNTWYIKAGCFWGTIAELKDEVLSTHKSMVYLANIAILEQL